MVRGVVKIKHILVCNPGDLAYSSDFLMETRGVMICGFPLNLMCVSKSNCMVLPVNQSQSCIDEFYVRIML